MTLVKGRDRDVAWLDCCDPKICLRYMGTSRIMRFKICIEPRTRWALRVGWNTQAIKTAFCGLRCTVESLLSVMLLQVEWSLNRSYLRHFLHNDKNFSRRLQGRKRQQACHACSHARSFRQIPVPIKVRSTWGKVHVAIEFLTRTKTGLCRRSGDGRIGWTNAI